MKNIQLIYRVLIVLTFLIALFSFAKWVDEVRPRYEWVEEIAVCEPIEGIDTCWFFCNRASGEKTYCQWVGEEGNCACYYEEKVRIK